MNNTLTVRVTDAPFGAKGDGITNDQKAIQTAIDHVAKNGGGTVILNGNTTFLSTNIVLRTGVELHFEDGAMLLQAQGVEGFVKPVGDGYESYIPIIGHNYSETIKWSHTWYRNYPFLYAPEGSHDFKITGNGTVRMSECTDPDKLVRMCPIGFYRCHHFEIDDITITNYHGYAIMPFTCDHGLFRNLKIREWSLANGDGICMMNCQDIRVTGCSMYTGDDSVYIFSSYKDPRASEWWSSDDPQPSVNIEIDHNDLESNHCKAFAMILWGIDCPDLEQVEVRNVYVHDNHFVTMGNWLYNPYTTKLDPHPVTDVRFENNKIDAIESNFFETQISNLSPFRSMRTLRNGDFKDGKVFWMLNGHATVVRDDNPHVTLSAGDGVYQGLYLQSGERISLFATGNTTGRYRIYVRHGETGALVARLTMTNAESKRKELLFAVPESGNYQVGVECMEGTTVLSELEMAGNIDTGTDYNRITKVGGKILYYYD